eukprot:jgi/Hompol1/1933/HPOL_005077-RA
MLTRSERKFLSPDKDHANPNLGPGCYTGDDPVLIAGKLVGNDGYAPFASLTPRVSYFDDTIVAGPAPGAYDSGIGVAATHRKDPASLFGRSRANRFNKSTSLTPGPGSYKIPSSINVKSIDGHRPAHATVHKFSLTQQPIGISLSRHEDPANTNDNTGSHSIAVPVPIQHEAQHGSHDLESIKTLSKSSTTQQAAFGVQTSPLAEGNAIATVYDLESYATYEGEPDLNGPEAKSLSLVSRKSSRDPSSKVAGVGNKSKDNTRAHHSMPFGTIIWRRKYVPPSIPAGRYAFGYQENTEGDLVPRKPPRKVVEEEPSYLVSFVEKSKHEARGYRFAKGGERMSYKVNEVPGPNRYNPFTGDKYLNTKSNGSGPAAMTLAPCKRLTDEIVADSVKKGIPGPGAYDIKAPLAEKIAQPRNRIRFGGISEERAYINPELMKIPGPGAYYPEFSNHPKVWPQLLRLGRIFRRVQNRAMYMSLRPAAFGSVAERFLEKRRVRLGVKISLARSNMPGPGTYEITQKKEEAMPANEIKMSLKGQAEKRKEHNKLQKLLNRGPTQLLLGSIHLPTANVHVPIFGTQTERFAEPASELPPPGAYDIAQSFDALRNKGRIENTGVLASQNKRELFPVPGSIPGPGEYNPVLNEHKEIRQKIGGFLSTGPRFAEKYERVPGPGSYQPPGFENGLAKKTFNITLTDWGSG